jgi:alpha-L-fucosidase
MLNEGPDGRGDFPPAAKTRLLELGTWLSRNGDSIYETTRSPLPQMPWGVATQHGNQLYLHVFHIPEDRILVVPDIDQRVERVSLLDGGAPLHYNQSASLAITLPSKLPPSADTVIRLETASAVADHSDDGVFIDQAYGRQTFDVADTMMSPDVSLDLVNTWLAVDDDRKFYAPMGLDDPSKFVRWKVQVVRPGDYHVDLQYAAAAAQAGREGFVTMGNQRLTFGVLRSGDIAKATYGNVADRQFAPLIYAPVGILSFTHAGSYTIQVSPASSGGDLFTLRALYLTPDN